MKNTPASNPDIAPVTLMTSDLLNIVHALEIEEMSAEWSERGDLYRDGHAHTLRTIRAALVARGR